MATDYFGKLRTAVRWLLPFFIAVFLLFGCGPSQSGQGSPVPGGQTEVTAVAGESAAEESQPAVEESQPAVEESQPAVEESQPAAEESQPAEEEPQPAGQAAAEGAQDATEEQQAEPGERQAEPGEPQAEPGERQAEPGEQQAEPGERQAKPGEQQAEPGEQQAEPEEPQSGSGEPQEDSGELAEDGSYTSKEEVALYIHTYGRLPDNFITKREAEELGWVSREGNLWEVAPGMSIGGSRFGNYEGLLPDKQGRSWYECDINFDGSYRGAERIVYSNDGLIYYTGDHYKTFEQLY